MFINRREVELHSTRLSGQEILTAGDYGPDYELFLLDGEIDPSGGRPVARDELLDVRAGEHFRAIPGNAIFGHTLLSNPLLGEDLSRLRAQGFDAEVLTEDADIGIVVANVPLIAGYTRAETDILLRTTILYPQSEMDMFWVEPDLLLVSGLEPAASSIEVHFGQLWRRFSWHRNSPWIPGRDDLLSHLEFARARLQDPT